LFQIGDDLKGAQGDENLLRHIFSNLLSNAVKYSRPGEPVEFIIHREGHHARFTIRDRGIGIPAADRPRLFEAFHRASNVGQAPGTGLGLLIVKRCVDLHQGSITFESEENHGTTFTVRLPLLPEGEPTLKPEDG
jgi:signal transduction histidine kinase